MKNKVWYYAEQYYPLTISIVVIIVILATKCTFWYAKDFNEVLNGAITFSSIIVGFLGALLAILASIRDTEIIVYIYSHVDKKLFMKFFQAAIIPGLLVVILSSAMFIVHCQPAFLYLGYIWAFLVTLFILSAFRIIDILMRIIFKDPFLTEELPKGNKLSEEKAEEIRKHFLKQ